MTIVHCSGLQYTPGLTMVHQTTNMLEALLPAVVHVRTGWGWGWWMVGGHQETAPPPAAPPPTLPVQLDPSLTPAPPWPSLVRISHIFPGLHKTFNFFLLQKKSPGPQAAIIMVQCCSCAGNSGTGTLVMRNEGAYRRKHYSGQP